MTVPAVNSALEAADWFFKQAEKEELFLENEKVQHLLFLAQVHYALLNGGAYLVPSLFLCNDSGFIEPNLAKTLSFGRPLMNGPRFAAPLNSFFSLIWQKYGALSIRDLSAFIKASPSYANHCLNGRNSIVDVTCTAAEFKNYLTPGALNKAAAPAAKKILISQNGPVVVSKWQPRKLSSQNSKENLNA